MSDNRASTPRRISLPLGKGRLTTHRIAPSVRRRDLDHAFLDVVRAPQWCSRSGSVHREVVERRSPPQPKSTLIHASRRGGTL
jgi:hypothetical protein